MNLYVFVLFKASFTTTLPSWSPKVAVFVAVAFPNSTFTSAPSLDQFPDFSIFVPFEIPDILRLVTLLLSSLTLIVGLNVAPLNTTNFAVVLISFVNVNPSIVAVGADVSDLLIGISISSVERSGYLIVAPI